MLIMVVVTVMRLLGNVQCWLRYENGVGERWRWDGRARHASMKALNRKDFTGPFSPDDPPVPS